MGFSLNIRNFLHKHSVHTQLSQNVKRAVQNVGKMNSIFAMEEISECCGVGTASVRLSYVNLFT